MDSIGVHKMPCDVHSVYAAYSPAARACLLPIRDMVLKIASENPNIGPLTETLKWGEPSFLTEETKSGTTLRLAWSAKSPNQSKILVNCKTNLVDEWRDIYNDVLTFEGQRAIVLLHSENYSVDALRHCIAMTLTYHIRKQKIGMIA